jgi:hypothetical protein
MSDFKENLKVMDFDVLPQEHQERRSLLLVSQKGDSNLSLTEHRKDFRQ